MAWRGVDRKGKDYGSDAFIYEERKGPDWKGTAWPGRVETGRECRGMERFGFILKKGKKDD